MEGYYWRFTDAAAGVVVVALCGVNRSLAGPWATVALAVHPGGHAAEALVPTARADAERFRVVAGDALEADAERLRVRLGGASLDVRLADVVGWPRRPLGGNGLGAVVPFLDQYWTPHVLGARVEGEAVVGGRRIPLGGATAYAEKNWGRGFPRYWWWGQAHGFGRDDACVAFTGGRLGLGPLGITASAVAVRLGDEVLRFSLPTAPVRADVGDGRWRLRGRDLRTEMAIDADAAGTAPHDLPVPVPAERRHVRLEEHLAGRLSVVVRRRGRTLFEGTSNLAGLEAGRLARCGGRFAVE